MIRPTQRLVAFSAAGIAVALLPLLLHVRFWIGWPAFLGVLLLATGLDLLWGAAGGRAQVTIQPPVRLLLGESGVLEVDLETARAFRPGRMDVLCDVEAGIEPPGPQRVDWTERHGRARVPLRPERRGLFALEQLWIRWDGPLGLVQRIRRVPLVAKVAVVPNPRKAHTSGVDFFNQRDILAGLNVERYVGNGSDFHALREYVPGLDTRSMDWRASARHRKLVCRELRAERNHQLVFALDTGHLMGEPLDGLSRLDHAIHAALRLSYVSLRCGDRVGMFAFDSQVRAFSEPHGGTRAFAKLQQQSAELAYSEAETNFTLGLTELSSRLKRRSLVVVLTEFVDTVSAELLLSNIERLSRKQLVVFVTLRDVGLEAVADAAPESLDTLYRATIAADMVRDRERVLLRLRRMGVHCIDSAPSGVSSALLSSYFEIRRKERI